MAAYSVVRWNDFSRVGLANYNTSEDTTIGILTQAALLGELQTVIVQGTITNNSWNWPTVGVPLWVSTAGVLVDIDPNVSDPITFPTARAPVAKVLSKTQIIFMQGLGAIGPVGPVGPPSAQVEATASTLGNVFLSFDCGGSPPTPTVISSCDPISDPSKNEIQMASSVKYVCAAEEGDTNRTSGSNCPMLSTKKATFQD